MASPIPVQFAPKNILLIKLRHHGDMLLTTPVINALRQRYPQANIDVLLYKETRPMLEAHPRFASCTSLTATGKRGRLAEVPPRDGSAFSCTCLSL